MSKNNVVSISEEVHRVLKLIASDNEISLKEAFNKAVDLYKKSFHKQLVQDNIKPPMPHPLKYPRKTRPVHVEVGDKSVVLDFAQRTFANSVQTSDSIVIYYQNAQCYEFPARLNWLDVNNLEWMKTIPEER